ncbi:aminopeptidase, partial [bacterium]|nr:aminopeptidase [bacterium]
QKAEEWLQACEALNQKIESSLASGQISPQLNQLLVKIERDLVESPGLPGRDWFRHRIYAPGFYTGYAAKPLPGVAEPSEDGDWAAAQKELNLLLSVLERVTQTTRQANGS